VSLRLDDLGSQIFGCTAEGPRPICQLFGETEVGDLQMTVPIEEEILGLQVAIHDRFRMQIIQSADYFSRVKVT
jgi:hypothetical protein